MPFFLVLRPLISSDQHGVFASKNIRAPEENIDSVDNILFYFSVMRDRYSSLPLCQPELAGNSNYPSSSFREALLYIYFPCSYSPRLIALLIFPSTCLTISVKQDFSRILRILNFALMNLPHFIHRPQGAFPWLSSKARQGCSSENFENTPKRYQNLVLWACSKCNNRQ